MNALAPFLEGLPIYISMTILLAWSFIYMAGVISEIFPPEE